MKEENGFQNWISTSEKNVRIKEYYFKVDRKSVSTGRNGEFV